MMVKNNPKKWDLKYRNIAEWAIIFAIPLVLYVTGWHTEVSGRLQQAVLWTGFVQPDTELAAKERVCVEDEMSLISLAGKKVNLSSLKGNVVFINFWATWCPPCIAEMPNIQVLYEEYKDYKHITFLMISLDENPEKAREFIERKGFAFPVYRLAGHRPRALQSPTIPTTYLLNKKGTIVVKSKGMANYNTSGFHSFIEKLLAE